MTKIIHIKVEDDVYFQLVMLKGRFKANSWGDMMAKIAQCLK